MRLLVLPALGWFGGCAAPPPLDVSTDTAPLTPAAEPVDGWVIEHATDPDLTCPDGRAARLWVARPEPAPQDGPVAIVFHAGAFDWVEGAPPDAPLAGRHHAAPSRLDEAWATREVHAALGTWTSSEPAIDAQGALAVALAQAGVTMLLPANCWGDLWHNDPNLAERENDTFRDGFARQGFALATRAWAIASDPDAAEALGLTLPDGGPRYLIGQSTGGRGVSELLHAGAEPAAIALDATPDDLDAFVRGDPLLYAGVVAGLPRLFPDGLDAMDDGALFTAPLPERVVYRWSSRDPAVPATAHDAALARLRAHEGASILDTGGLGHVASAGSLAHARALVEALLGTAADTRRVDRVDAHPIGQ